MTSLVSRTTLLSLLQFLVLSLLLPTAVLALMIVERYGWKEFIVPLLAVSSCYAAAIYLLVVGRKGSWEEAIARWLRDRVLSHVPTLLAALLILGVLMAAQLRLLVRDRVIELKGQVLLNNRPITQPALLRVVGHPQTWSSQPNGMFLIEVRDEGQAEISVTAEQNDLTGLRVVKRGGHRGFEIALDSQIVVSTAGELSKSFAVVRTPTVPASEPSHAVQSGGNPYTRNVLLLAAAQAPSLALELAEERHGAFTQFLLEAIKTRRLTTGQEIFEYVAARTVAATQRRQMPYAAGPRDMRLPLTSGRFDRPEDVLALVVGLTEYADTSLPAPVYATHDAVAVYNWLLEAGALPKNTLLLLNRFATRAAVMKELELLGERAGPGTFVLFYYSGMGGVEKDLDGDEADLLDEYITCYDTLGADLNASAISDDWFGHTLGRIGGKSHRVMAALDTSHAFPIRR